MKKTTFNKLKDAWYKKLAKSGFVDVERDEVYLKRNVSTIDYRRVTWESQADYSHMTTHFLNDYAFKNNRQRNIWEYHSNGISTRDIAKILNKVSKKKVTKDTIRMVIFELREEMKKLYGVTK